MKSDFQSLIPKVKNTFDRWLMRDLSLKGRVLYSKTEGLSRVLYPPKVLDVSKPFIKKIDLIKLFNFIWKHKPD